ncbi:hypothetical protein NliqN6_6578 [Naganishia liquefaciens]|uniref:Uncharacterized protein n=1 Tax=Naganishia liquefaciens TaxID=104408 RepID=A0A8H3YK45_9TREE|nr:hypothetical protein NliqN6_6578 [Naganishia liquefaciens]
MSANNLGVSPADSTSSLDINDAIFCEHGKEVCNDCNFDAREENDSFFGFDLTARDPLSLPAYTVNAKDGSIQCKKHSSSSCTTCFGWKKQLAKLHKEGAKKAKSKKEPTSNLFV